MILMSKQMFKMKTSWDMMTHSFNPRTQKMKTGRSWVRGHSWTHIRFYDGPSCKRRPHNKQQKSKNTHIKTTVMIEPIFF